MPDERDLLDIDNLRTVEEVIAWLRQARDICCETADHAQSRKDQYRLEGRAQAFGLAALLIENVTRAAAEDACRDCPGSEGGCMEHPAECGRQS